MKPTVAPDLILLKHRWLETGYCAGNGYALVPNTQGCKMLRQLGRSAWLAQLSIELALPEETRATARWRLLDEALIQANADAVERSIASPRPRNALVLGETEQAGEHRLQLRLPLDLPHWDGHFPQAPLLPGVLQIQWALELASPRLTTRPACRAMEALKFQRLLRPGDHVELRLRYDPVHGKLYFAYYQDGAHCSSGRLIMDGGT